VDVAKNLAVLEGKLMKSGVDHDGEVMVQNFLG
jgi:hypothetical protein